MKTATLKIELLGWWHAGSGQGRGGDVDALVIRDANGLPFLPARTVKGLLRDAVRLADVFLQPATSMTDSLFGAEDPTTLHKESGHQDYETPGREPGQLSFTNATLTAPFAEWLKAGGPARLSAIFSAVNSSALDENGIAKDQTLRSIEVCPPMELCAKITGPDDGAWITTLQERAGLVRALGSHRHRGLGRCRMIVSEDPASQPAGSAPMLSPSEAGMNAGCVWLDIELLSDLIVSASAATTGGHDSLNYLPGSVLMGAAAGAFSAQRQFAPEIFLSGKIRFGDGLPLAPDGDVGWPVPLNCHFIKLDGPKGPVINGLTDTKQDAENRAKKKQQAQQLRNGHLTPAGVRFDLEGDYLLKTALDRDSFGRAKDRQLFEYETLRAGARFRAAIRWDDTSLNPKIKEIVSVLTRSGIGLGRSRSAQFGQVNIKLATAPAEPESKDAGTSAQEPDVPVNPLHFYLASDLALTLDGSPRLTPQPEDFGMPPEWRFIHDRSFLRTRRYSPWNAFHHTRLTERQVLMRGSVLTFARKDDKAATAPELKSIREKLGKGVGEYCSEGLGWVLLNPDFILKLPELKSAPEVTSQPANANQPESPLADWIARREVAGTVRHEALNLGQELAKKWKGLHESAAKAERLGRSGRSQWNEVRQLAIRAQGNAAKLRRDLEIFCTSGLRRKYWNPSGDHTLWKALSACFDQEPSPFDEATASAKVCAAIAVAAETMLHRLQQTKNDDKTPVRSSQTQETHP
jgi:CRISPR/Cas system CSM-associated protein Csm3 (group 7 of RAMP superfamily)